MKNIILITLICFLTSHLFASNIGVKVLAKTNCNISSKHVIDIYVQRANSATPVNLLLQNYRFSYNQLALTNPFILTANSDLNFENEALSNNGNNSSFFNNPNLNGSEPGLISLNIDAAEDEDGYFLSPTSLTYVCSVEFDIVSAAESVNFIWHNATMFPHTYISTLDGAIIKEVPVSFYDGIQVSFSSTFSGMKANVQPNDTYTYLWNGGDTGSIKDGACPDEDHTVTVTDSNGCSETFTYTSGNIPSGGFEVEEVTPVDETPRLAYNPCGGPTLGGGVIILQADDFIIDGQLGGINGNGYVLGQLGGGKISADLSNIEIYPNPANSILTINLEIDEFDKGEIKLFSLVGREVLSADIQSGVEKTTIDISNIENGVYIIKIITDGNETHTQKLTIAH